MIFLLTQRSWRCIFWATDEQTGLDSLLIGRAWLGRPAVGGGAFRLPFSVIPCWVTLWTPKEIKQNEAEHQVDPTVRLIFENFFEDSNHRCCLLMLSVFPRLCLSSNWGFLCDWTQKDFFLGRQLHIYPDRWNIIAAAANFMTSTTIFQLFDRFGSQICCMKQQHCKLNMILEKCQTCVIFHL